MRGEKILTAEEEHINNNAEQQGTHQKQTPKLGQQTLAAEIEEEDIGSETHHHTDEHVRDIDI